MKNKGQSLKPLEINSTGLLQCPISLEVMRSPVSLSTGVTYDRSSIQKWLDSGHRTCPATCQHLSSTDLVPNLTLRNLIALSDPLMADPLIENPLALLSETDLERSESIVVSLSSIEGEMREKVVSYLVENLDASTSALIRVLKDGNAIESRIAASRLIELILSSSFCDDNELKIGIIERSKLFDEMLCLIKDGYDNYDQNAILTGIKCMLTLIELNEKKLRVKMVRSGAIPTMVMVIKSAEISADVAGKAMMLLEHASRCKEGLEELINGDTKEIIKILAEKMMRVGRGGREAAMGTIWAMCSKAEEREIVKKMKELLVTKLLMVMQEDCSPVVALMAGDLLRVICVGEKKNEGDLEISNYTKTMHIMPF